MKRNSSNTSFNMKSKIKVDLTHTKYKVVRECCEELGWEVFDDNAKRLFDDIATRTETRK